MLGITDVDFGAGLTKQQSLKGNEVGQLISDTPTRAGARQKPLGFTEAFGELVERITDLVK